MRPVETRISERFRYRCELLFRVGEVRRFAPRDVKMQSNLMISMQLLPRSRWPAESIIRWFSGARPGVVRKSTKDL